MPKRYCDWTDWAGDHPEQAEADLHRDRVRAGTALAGISPSGIDLDAPEPDADCGHTDFYPNGYCADCGEPVPDFEPTDDMIETDYLNRNFAA